MKETILATVLAFATVFSAVRAQPMHSHDPGEKVGREAYSPGLGEIMALQQMRHSKLWFAGDARNWDLAGYELDELKEGFEGAAKLFRKATSMRATTFLLHPRRLIAQCKP